VLGLVPLVFHSLGGRLGEPAADDWDFVTYALFRPFSFFDGGGSSAFWRPLTHQVYYRLIAPMLPMHAGVVPAVHGVLLLLITLVLYRMLRPRMPGAWAACAATFPLLAESTRMALQWPGLGIELAFTLFTVLAFHEARRGRLPTALLALLAALLSKEVAVVGALALPWVARPAAGATRRRWAIATAALTAAWAIAYLLVRRAHDLRLPHGFEAETEAAHASIVSRYAWTLLQAMRATMSLPAVHVARETTAFVALAALLGWAAWIHRRDASARRRLRDVAPLVGAGLAWFALTLAPLVVVYPMWMPHRVLIAAIGLGLALTLFLASAWPALAAALLVIRLGLFAMSPGPPSQVAMTPPTTGAFLDFAKLARLQLLMRDTREALAARYPTLPHGALIATLHAPHFALYAYGGNQALQVWYRDTTLHWARYDDLRLHPELEPVTILDFEAPERPQLRFVSPEAMRHYIAGEALTDAQNWSAALAELQRADSLQPDSGAHAFRSRVAGRRAFALLGLRQPRNAVREAFRSLALWRDCAEARYTLASAFAFTGIYGEANRQLDTLFELYPNDRSARTLRDTLVAWGKRPRR
jgi:hypothetical protein